MKLGLLLGQFWIKVKAGRVDLALPLNTRIDLLLPELLKLPVTFSIVLNLENSQLVLQALDSIFLYILAMLKEILNV